MHNPYKDIRDKLGEPKWWDEYAVPRYCEFTPDEAADIYADQVALVKIGCQGCGCKMLVAMSESVMSKLMDDPNYTTLKEAITLGSFSIMATRRISDAVRQVRP